ncbi:FAD dependent oxidoreductase [Rhizobium sp. PDO1-076]|uniref:FAD/NAD(P)-binding protein n=1 Tax=Rhizobium sp. PDO1-076 TaxID=1125979 RepID=UPI00024E3ACF|nr:FAD/NAD(P)-binding protein [Rhizobium sp. PDO1-076]EHS52617.1 FAD dependent oxidoreductase [Rhizobium sp. PDO1-076]
MLRITMPDPQQSRSRHSAQTRVAIIGGGYTGAIIAFHLANRSHESVDQIAIFEPRASLGAGLAYSTDDASLRLNVAAHRMRAVPGDPGAFSSWLEATGRLSIDVASITSGGTFARRRDFGAFMDSLLQPKVETGQIRHVREQLVRLDRKSNEWILTGDKGTVVTADVVVIATGHAPSKIPDQVPARLVGTKRCIGAAEIAESQIDANEHVLIVGAGLTSLDALASLRSRHHKGQISILSRTGLLPRKQAGGDFTPFGDFDLERPTAREVLKRIRHLVQQVTDQGMPWQSVMDALRHQGQPLWMRMQASEQARVLRHLRRWYEVHRFRMPPQIEALLREENNLPTLSFITGHLKSVRMPEDKICVEIKGAKPSAVQKLQVDRIVVATGPDQKNVLDYQGFLKDLATSGTLQPDSLGLGIACDKHCRAISRGGRPQASLMIAGPLTRGTFGEITGVPEIAAQATCIVETILRTTVRPVRIIEISTHD